MKGDPNLSNLEHLLSRAGRMRSLARALCADAAGAEDLVQDAFVAALEKGPARASSPSAWLARVLANLSTDRRRAESARRERERRTSRAEAVPSAGDLVERAEVQRRLVECVLALPEPYRATVLERWFEERTPDEIARRLGIPASTVRTRLARGLALLRERLEREEGRSWMSALAPLVSFDLAARPGSLAAPAALSGGALVSTGTKVAIGIGALAVATWIAWPRLEREPESAPVAAAEAPPELEPDPVVESVVSGPTREESPIERSVSVAAAPEAPVKLSPEPSEAECERMEEGLVPASTLAGIVLRGREPVDRGSAYLAHGVRFVPKDPKETWIGLAASATPPGKTEVSKCRIGRDGRFAFENLPPDWYTLAIDVGGGTCRQMHFNLMRGKRPARTVVIVLGTAKIAGHVYDDDGRPLADARVLASLEVVRNQEHRGFTTVAWTDARGAYELGELAAGTYLVGLRREGREDDPNFDETLEATVEIGEERTVDFGRAGRKPVWHGVVRARTGEPAAGGGRIEIEGGEPKRKLHTRYDESGAFRVTLMPGHYAAQVRAVGDPMRMVDLGEVDVPEGGIAHDLVLPGTRIRGIALDGRTGMTWPDPTGFSISLRPIDQEYPAAITSATIGTGGVFVFDGVGPGTWVLGGHPLEILGVPEGRIELTVRPNELEVPLTVTIGLREK